MILIFCYCFIFIKVSSRILAKEDDYRSVKRQLHRGNHHSVKNSVFPVEHHIRRQNYGHLHFNEIFVESDENSDEGVVMEVGNGTDHRYFRNKFDSSLVEKLLLDGTADGFGAKCSSGDQSAGEGTCYPKEICLDKGGQVGNRCINSEPLFCCMFVHTCGDTSSETVTYFQSPEETSGKTEGSLACDYDVTIQKDVCAVRIEYIHVNLARKLGGVCDIDQIYVLNSVDGPTTGQCGPLSGYVSTVAVKPHQEKPLKIALLIQNEGIYFWKMKLTQLECNNVHNFKAPEICGINRFTEDINNHLSPNMFDQDHSGITDNLLEIANNKMRRAIWWNYPEPVFNRYHFSASKKLLLQEQKRSSGILPPKLINADRRIVGGSDASLNEFPWQVAIALGNMFFCGAALINELFVVTAAHCIMTRDTRIENLILYLGDHDLTITNETNHVIRGVKRILFHSHFHPFLLDNDIAMLQLDKPVAFTSNIQPICLPNPSESYSDKKATVVGWGITSYPMGNPSGVLQKIQAEVISNFQCSRIIEEPLGAGMLCAAPSASQGTCFGDSGSPLSTESEHGQNILIGLVSYGLTGCALVPSFPDIYTRVSEYVKWIDVNAIHS